MRTISLGFVALVTAAVLLAPPASPVAAADEATLKLFKSQCATCHGVDGKGKTTAGQKVKVRDWTDAKTFEGLTKEKIATIIRDGVKGDDGKKRMPGLSKPTDAKITALVDYVMTFAPKK